MTGKREIVKEKKGRPWLIPAVAAAAVVGGYAGFCIAAAAGDAVNPHTIVGGQDVGGLTRTEAVQVLSPALNDLCANSGVHLTVENDREIAYLTYGELGVTFNAEALAEEAYESSHSGNALTDGWNLLSATFGRHTAVTPEPAPGWEKPAAEKLAAAGQLGATDFSYEVGTDSLTLTKARDGRDVDKLALESRLADADADESGSRRVDLPYAVISADQGDLGALNNALGGEMANARYDAETDTIIPERPALNFNVAQAQMLLDAAAPGEQVVVPAESSTPTVTAAELKEVLFRDVLGTYTTRVGGAAGRKANVKLTAQHVNGTILNSGEEFNYFELAGPFSAANGYQPAPGYLNGKTVDMDGGGACQCSSTTYAAALTANMEIVARTAHGFASDYIGLGLDATVANGGPDFIFRNNTPYPIKVEAIYSADNRLTVNILGTKTDDTTVKMRTVVLSTTPFEEEIKESEELAPGERKVDQTPYTGYVVDTYRQIYDGAGNLISETYEARSRYKARNRIILVGPGGLEGEGGETPPEGGETPVTPTEPVTPVEPVNPVDPIPVPTDPEPAVPESELPGGVVPEPIDQQIDQLPSGEAEARGV